VYSRTRCRVQVSHWERPRLFAEVSSGPLFVIRGGPTQCELCSTFAYRRINDCEMALEGIVSKRKDSPYRSGRSPDSANVAIAASRVASAN
jgi:hypothetical protein